MKRVLFILLLVFAPPSSGAEFRLPFNGRWFVMQGGDTPNVNHHMSLAAQWYALDFAMVGGPSERELTRAAGSRVEDFFSWNEPVLSPADGVIISVVNSLPDNALGVKDSRNPGGNFVCIQSGPRQFVFLAHLRATSVTVKAGQRVKAGEIVGRCGNSGNSDFPHLHFHVQDAPQFNEGTGQNPIFANINVELTGKRFERVSWPLIRGLFVWSP